MKIIIYILTLFIGIIIGIMANHYYLLFKFRGYKKYTLFIENIRKYKNNSLNYSYTSPASITKTIINICSDNNIPIANVDFELDILGEDVGVKIYCTNDQLKNLKINLLKYRENFYVKKVCRGFKSI